MTARMIWENIQPQLQLCADACIVFDDSVLNKDHSHKIDLVAYQVSISTLENGKRLSSVSIGLIL